MDPIKIEKTGVNYIKDIVLLHDLLNDHINDGEKGPSWDGFIYVLSKERIMVNSITYIVPVQIKGKNSPKLLGKDIISYAVEYKHLRNYRKTNGVCYFVVVTSDDRKEREVFYSAITPVKLNALLKDTESKRDNQTKNIVLKKLPGNSLEELYRILAQFGHDSQEQGNGELVRKALQLDDIKFIDSMRVTAFVNNTKDIMQGVMTGEIGIYGHRKDFDMWMPIDYNTQRKLFINSKKVTEVSKSFGIDGVMYYDKFQIEEFSTGESVTRLSENLIIDNKTLQLHFTPVSTIKEAFQDIMFLRAFSDGHFFCIDGVDVLDYGGGKQNEGTSDILKYFERAYYCFEKLNVSFDKKMSEFSDADWKSLDIITGIYSGFLKLEDISSVFYWKFHYKIIPVLVVSSKGEKNDIYNYLEDNNIKICAVCPSERNRIPRFVRLKKQQWIELYDIEREILFNDLGQSEINEVTKDELLISMLELLLAYDICKNETYYELAGKIVDELLNWNSADVVYIINRLQIIKRKRDLTEEEMLKLESIWNSTDNPSVKCATSILLGNNRQAKKELDMIDGEDREFFCSNQYITCLMGKGDIIPQYHLS